ncbi:MAG: M28 family peptidase [Anaerolineales bacterium]|nr:M28 family peptidase [Anaerolineales bacterium]
MTRWSPPIQTRIWSLSIVLLLLTGTVACGPQEILLFDGQRAYEHVQAQVALGARLPGSPAHAAAREYIRQELADLGWDVVLQETTWNEFAVKNIIATRQPFHQEPRLLLGAHYDSRLFADQDIGQARFEPVPGANDGASGVAVLLELARVLPNEISLWLVFFDAEDNGGIEGREWIMGSLAFVAEFPIRPEAVVIVDMVGDRDLNLYYEANSSLILRQEIWEQAASLGYTQFIPQVKYSLLDDHIPFLKANIESVLLIDFDYPYWHTTADTVDKVSPQSLEAVGRTLQTWIIQNFQP